MRLDRKPQPLQFALAQLGVADAFQHLGHIDLRSPGAHGIQPHQQCHVLTVRRDGGTGQMTASAFGHAATSRIHHKAGRQPFQIPFERCRQCLVEVGDVEHRCPVSRGIDAKVRQMTVAARLHGQPALRGRCQIGCHYRG
jgi:hypothetical protein